MNYTFSKIFLFIALILSTASVIYVYLVAENKVLIKEKLAKQEVLYLKKNLAAEKLVETQKLMAEERIVEYARTKLDLVRDYEPFEKIKVNKITINQLVKLVNEKYD